MRLCIGSTRLFFNTVAAGLMSVISDNNLLISVEPLPSSIEQTRTCISVYVVYLCIYVSIIVSIGINFDLW